MFNLPLPLAKELDDLEQDLLQTRLRRLKFCFDKGFIQDEAKLAPTDGTPPAQYLNIYWIGNPLLCFSQAFTEDHYPLVMLNDFKNTPIISPALQIHYLISGAGEAGKEEAFPTWKAIFILHHYFSFPKEFDLMLIKNSFLLPKNFPLKSYTEAALAELSTRSVL